MNGHELFGNLRIAPFGDGCVVISMFGEPGIAVPIICDDSGARRHDVLDEAAERIGTPVRRRCKPDTPGIATVPAFIERAATFAVAHFNGSGHNSLVVHASPLPACPTAHAGFIIDLDVFTGLPTDSVLIRTNHASAELMENLEGGLVVRQSELPLELDGRHHRARSR